ncbi:hypothetical protein [Ruminiclostridium cellobioparum]|jgi:hypothetical protein|uniref:Uncharacterized protein n=1 Tax=Ruminiclostridium cellobioparum subsp. termitidis CT1112 TaxID=1195236 RepID=S0FKQ1_RUMCE|nr:hypothetical protein [Ruminiclostridium cellobioparum]EMS70876.1 hypothetical protein CTER_3350 [Ruminiclostridium cellobioparum subsp. termitidis CT1112]
MKGWNPFGKVDMEIGSFLKASPFNKEYKWGKAESGNSEKDDKKGK